ncbi:MAG: DUF3078 domain-containing protein [Bacteroidetes bacterium]|nr:DUF3078 domain-containing protein [Bacteroidota bacterium]
MKNLFIALAIFTLSFSFLLAQDSIQAPIDTSYWKNSGIASFNVTNTSVSSYWQAGGINSRSFAFRIDMSGHYDKDKTSWHNSLVVAYGTIRQGRKQNSFIKNDDRLEINSKFGFHFSKNLLISGLASFRTQFFEGYNFDPKSPTTVPSDTVSNFLSPAYLEFGIGMDYQPIKDFSIYYSPINSKITILTVEAYRPLYVPQDNIDQAVRYELGSRLKVRLKRTIAKNILFQANASFFTNYLKNPGNIDINWETLTTAKVNSWLAINFSTNLIYDDDVKFNLLDENGVKTGKLGPRTQFQHILAIGLTYQFIK